MLWYKFVWDLHRGARNIDSTGSTSSLKMFEVKIHDGRWESNHHFKHRITTRTYLSKFFRILAPKFNNGINSTPIARSQFLQVFFCPWKTLGFANLTVVVSLLCQGLLLQWLPHMWNKNFGRWSCLVLNDEQMSSLDGTFSRS